MMNVISVLEGMGYGVDSFPTTSKSLVSLYNPTVVVYGLKSDPVIASMSWPLDPDIVELRFCV